MDNGREIFDVIDRGSRFHQNISEFSLPCVMYSTLLNCHIPFKFTEKLALESG